MTEQDIIDTLTAMERDPALITEPSFTTNTISWPDRQIPFVDYHLQYLRTHKHVQSDGYLSNLRIMIRRRE